jgi:CO/xanthine dehydrogenase FAD-binding subunit
MITAYHRAQSIEDALRLQARAGVKTALLPGYDAIVDESFDEVVDLQVIKLRSIRINGTVLTLESLVLLQSVVEQADLPDWLRQIAREEEPSTLRNMRTIASVITAASAESLLLAVLLVADAHLNLQSLAGTRRVSLSDYLTKPTEGFPVALMLALDGQVAIAKVGRTPADKPIVAAAARRASDGGVRLALCGVAPTPILVRPEALDALTPVGDFRGSAEYRREMAFVLSQHVLGQV